MQDAWIIVIIAIRSGFDLDRVEARLSTYITRYLIPRLTREKIRYESILAPRLGAVGRRCKLLGWRNWFIGRYGQEPTRDELSGVTGQSSHTIKRLFALARRWVSIDHAEERWKVSIQSAKKYLPWFRIDATRDPYEIYEQKAKVESIARALSCLNYKARMAVVLQYGLFGARRHTQQEIATKFGCSKIHVRTIIRKALDRLRHPVRAKYMEDFTGCRIKEGSVVSHVL